MRLRLPRSPLQGIDMSPGHARLMSCTRTRSAWRVDRWADRELPPGSLENAQVAQFDEVSSAVRELVLASDAGPRVAMGLPPGATRHHVLAVPPSVRPWTWRSWLRAQAEQLAGAPADALAFDVQMLQASPLRVLLSLCPREVLEDWQGLAEAAGLELVLLDDRVRVMRLALQALGLMAAADGEGTLAEVGAERCLLHAWRAAQAPLTQAWDGGAELDLPAASAGCWLIGSAGEVEIWSQRLAARTGTSWSPLNLQQRLDWSAQGAAPAEPDAFLAAFGLAVRAWQP